MLSAGHIMANEHPMPRVGVEAANAFIRAASVEEKRQALLWEQVVSEVGFVIGSRTPVGDCDKYIGLCSQRTPA